MATLITVILTTTAMKVHQHEQLSTSEKNISTEFIQQRDFFELQKFKNNTFISLSALIK